MGTADEAYASQQVDAQSDVLALQVQLRQTACDLGAAVGLACQQQAAHRQTLLLVCDPSTVPVVQLHPIPPPFMYAGNERSEISGQAPAAQAQAFDQQSVS